MENYVKAITFSGYVNIVMAFFIVTAIIALIVLYCTKGSKKTKPFWHNALLIPSLISLSNIVVSLVQQFLISGVAIFRINLSTFMLVFEIIKLVIVGASALSFIVLAIITLIKYSKLTDIKEEIAPEIICSCGEHNLSNSVYCKKCGKKLVALKMNFCPKCGTKIKDEFCYCNKCGKKLR